MTAYVFLADGFEEIEALTPVDLLRRAGVNVITIATGDSLTVTGAHGVKIESDIMLRDGNLPEADMLVCPGGMPGASNLASSRVLGDMLIKQFRQGRYVAAICAAPAVTLAPLGILEGKRATCYPGFDPQLTQAEATHVAERVVTDANVITANGPSSAMPFAIKLVEVLNGQEAAKAVAQGILL